MIWGSGFAFFSIPDPDPGAGSATLLITYGTVLYITLNTHFDYSYIAFREVKAFIDECLNQGGKVLGK
jgi:hypothetical protein